MVFSSVAFLFYFLPVVIVLYFLAPCRIKNLVLLAASLFFYAWGEPVYVFLMIASIILNFIMGIAINKGNSKKMLGLGIIVNIMVLGFFKYADFLIETVNNIFSTELGYFDLPLPIGISFYTFQAMSYLIDLYRGQVKLQKNIIDFATYIALFPQLIAGPIVRIKSIEEQLHFRINNWNMFGSGVKRFVVGLGKKVLIANNVGLIWNQISQSDISGLSVASAWLGAIAFTLQIYFDFSGYSDMAIGLGRMFGFSFPENFKYPYISCSITEFWRRWHISLGTWFKEYVYIPLGGNKKGKAVQLLNILIVWMLTGLWHGANWNFVLWGLYFAIILVLEKLFLLRILNVLPNTICRIYTMFLVIVSWVIFSLDNTTDILNYCGALFGYGSSGIIDETAMYLLSGNAVLIIIAIIGSTRIPVLISRLFLSLLERAEVLRGIVEGIWISALVLLSTSYIVASTYNPFLYFRF